MRRARLATGLLRLIFALVVMSGVPTAWAGDAMRCGGELVQRNDLAALVIARCGEPHFVDAWPDMRSGARLLPSGTEQWYYNFGPARLLQILRFREGRLQSIQSGGHGFNAPGPGRCQPADIQLSLSKYHLLALCGEPLQIENRVVVISQGPSFRQYRHPGLGGYVLRERWYYNFGASRLLRKVTLENGRVVDVQTTDDRGFRP